MHGMWPWQRCVCTNWGAAGSTAFANCVVARPTVCHSGHRVSTTSGAVCKDRLPTAGPWERLQIFGSTDRAEWAGRCARRFFTTSGGFRHATQVLFFSTTASRGWGGYCCVSPQNVFLVCLETWWNVVFMACSVLIQWNLGWFCQCRIFNYQLYSNKSNVNHVFCSIFAQMCLVIIYTMMCWQVKIWRENISILFSACNVEQMSILGLFTSLLDVQKILLERYWWSPEYKSSIQAYKVSVIGQDMFVCVFVCWYKTRNSILFSLCLEESNNTWEWLHRSSDSDHVRETKTVAQTTNSIYG